MSTRQSSHRLPSAKQPRQPVLAEQTKQISKMARNEIDELRESLRYAEYLLSKTRQEKEEVEGELQTHDAKVGEVRREVAQKENEYRDLQ